MVVVNRSSSPSRPPQPSGGPRTVSAAQAADRVQDGDHVVTSGCGAAPIEFLAALAGRTDLASACVSHATAWGALPHLDGERLPAHIHFQAYFLPALGRALHRAGKIDYVPLTFSQMGSMYRAGDLKSDVVAVTCSPPDPDGFCSLGPFVSYLPAAIREARVLVGECTPTWPRTSGAALVHHSLFDCFVEVKRSPIVSKPDAGQPEAAAIAARIVDLVSDGATIQIGRGAIPNAVAGKLAGRRDLGIHSEMISDWIVDLVESGAVTGSRKVSHPGRIVTSFMDGTARLYDFVDGNADLVLQPIYEVNDPAAIGREPDFIAINSAVEVDLTGQINAETIDGRLISGSGGLLDFALGAQRSSGGKFIVALPATAKSGAVSRIVARMAPGAAITVPRALAHLVITEHGVADLRGCTLKERARRLVAIADPRFREELAAGSRGTA
jgi:4-hydroxybutyrate CoA-transferase